MQEKPVDKATDVEAKKDTSKAHVMDPTEADEDEEEYDDEMGGKNIVMLHFSHLEWHYCLTAILSKV